MKSPVSGKSGGKQPPSPDKPGSSPLNRKDDEKEEKERKVQDDDDDNMPPHLKKLADSIGALNKRLDAMEARAQDDDNDDDVGVPKDLAVDDARSSYKRNELMLKRGQLGKIICDGITMDEFVRCQARADKVYSMWGKSAERAFRPKSTELTPSHTPNGPTKSATSSSASSTSSSSSGTSAPASTAAP